MSRKMKILIGLSGGFDSAYAVKLLLEEGHEVAAATLVMHDYTDTERAREVAALLGIPLFEIDARDVFDRVVKDNFATEYSRGRTPNPCIICNPLVKFRLLADLAREKGYDRIATGHYARLVDYIDRDGIAHRTLATPLDTAKDQTYMLYRLPVDILEMLYLPLSSSVKKELRSSVVDTPLASIDVKDSQEICFLPDGDYPSFVTDRIGKTKVGNFVTEDGTIIAPHKGIIHYTVGQRKGLGVSLGERAFVTDIDSESGDITLSTTPKLGKRIHLTDVVTPAIVANEGREDALSVKVRYAAPRVPAKVTFLAGDRAEVLLDEPQRSVTKGQSVVFYDGDVLIGGGIIDLVE